MPPAFLYQEMMSRYNELIDEYNELERKYEELEKKLRSARNEIQDMIVDADKDSLQSGLVLALSILDECCSASRRNSNSKLS